MCGCCRLSRRKQIIEEHFDSVSGEEDWSPRYNIAPTQPVPVIRQNSKEPVRELSLMRWGLIPSWSKDSSTAASMINARAETASTKPAFRDALKSRRCLIPADGFYEWKRDGKTKQPYCFEVNEGELFAFAGIWDRWRDPSGQWVKSCSILTTTPNAVTSAVHDRMPAILDPDAYDMWLDPGMNIQLSAFLGAGCPGSRVGSTPAAQRARKSQVKPMQSVSRFSWDSLFLDNIGACRTGTHSALRFSRRQTSGLLPAGCCVRDRDRWVSPCPTLLVDSSSRQTSRCAVECDLRIRTGALRLADRRDL